MKMLRFGGPTFPETNECGAKIRTWFYDTQQPTNDGGFVQVPAYWGQEFELSRVLNADHYIGQGMAEIVDVDVPELSAHGGD